MIADLARGVSALSDWVISSDKVGVAPIATGTFQRTPSSDILSIS